MKARVKYNNEIIDVIQVGTKTHLFDLNNVEFLDNPQDYWTRLEHTYVGMFMKSFLDNFDGTTSMEILADDAIQLAHTLVERMKKEVRK